MKTLSQRLAKELTFFNKYTHKRCINQEGVCRYHGSSIELKTKGCLIGRMIPAQTAKEIDSTFGGISIECLQRKLRSGNYPMTLPKYLREASSNLLQSFQTLHDSDQYWELDKGGLSEVGKELLKTLVGKYDELNPEDFKHLLTE